VVGGDTYDNLMRSRLFAADAMGMESTLPSGVGEAIATGKYATPYWSGVECPPDINARVDRVAPCGAVISSASDMAKYAQMHLGDGVVNGRRIVSSKSMKVLHTSEQTIVNSLTYTPGALFSATWRDSPVLEHGGNLHGYTSLMFLNMGLGVGAVVLTNQDNNELLEDVAKAAIDVATGTVPEVPLGSPCEGSKGVSSKSIAPEVAAVERHLFEPEPRKLGTVMAQTEDMQLQGRWWWRSQSMKNIVGEYNHPFWGQLTVHEDALSLGQISCTKKRQFLVWLWLDCEVTSWPREIAQFPMTGKVFRRWWPWGRATISLPLDQFSVTFSPSS